MIHKTTSRQSIRTRCRARNSAGLLRPQRHRRQPHPTQRSLPLARKTKVNLMPAVLEKDIKSWLSEAIQPEEFSEKNFKTSGILFEAVVSQEKIRDVAREFLAKGNFLESLTAVDFAECLEVVYHFNRWDGVSRSCVKSLVAKENGTPGDGSWKTPSISSIYKSAYW